MNSPIRPVSDEHRHEPADYELEPNELAADRETLEGMLESRRSSLASCERMLELLQPEWDRFEKRDGSHDTYVARDYADHTSAARKHRKEIAALEVALTALTQAPRSCWQPIEQKPDRDMAVLYFFSNLEFRSMDGGPSTMGPIRDHAERCEIGFYFAEHSMWCEAGTGHDVFECWRDKSDFPTHWQPLPEPPATAIRSNSHD